jgi:hypothetical protein
MFFVKYKDDLATFKQFGETGTFKIDPPYHISFPTQFQIAHQGSRIAQSHLSRSPFEVKVFVSEYRSIDRNTGYFLLLTKVRWLAKAKPADFDTVDLHSAYEAEIVLSQGGPKSADKFPLTSGRLNLKEKFSFGMAESTYGLSVNITSFPDLRFDKNGDLKSASGLQFDDSQDRLIFTRQT